MAAEQPIYLRIAPRLREQAHGESPLAEDIGHTTKPLNPSLQSPPPTPPARLTSWPAIPGARVAVP